MTSALSPIVLKEDGSLDLEAFPRAGIGSTADWLKLRLAGQDPYLPAGPADDEPPYNLVIEILEHLGSGHDASITLAQAAMRLLEGGLSGKVGSHFGNLLAVCERVRLPIVQPWFVDRLWTLATHPEAFEGGWAGWAGGGLQTQIVRAATLQAPASLSEAVNGMWLRVLTMGDYSTIALFAFGWRFEDHAPHLDTWWRSCSSATRERELQQILSSAIAQEPDIVRELVRTGSGWDASLRAAIDRTLEGMRHLPLFSGLEMITVTVLALVSNPKDRQGLESIFQRSNWKLCFANSLEEWTRSRPRTPVAVVIVDWPDARIASILASQKPPPRVILADRNPADALWPEALAAGAFNVLQKPFDPHEVFWVVSHAWRDWKAEFGGYRQRRPMPASAGLEAIKQA